MQSNMEDNMEKDTNPGLDMENEEVKVEATESEEVKENTAGKENSSEESSSETMDEEREDEMKKFRESKKEVTELKEEVESLKDKLLRTVAEYDNFRKRTIKEKENIYSDSCADVLKEVLPVLDNLERAISAEGSADDLKKGVEMTVTQFKTSLEKLGVEEISVEGEFDPNFHNAVMHVDDENLGKNQVAEVFQKGYKRGDKVLRYSMVKVAN